MLYIMNCHTLVSMQTVIYKITYMICDVCTVICSFCWSCLPVFDFYFWLIQITMFELIAIILHGVQFVFAYQPHQLCCEMLSEVERWKSCQAK